MLAIKSKNKEISVFHKIMNDKGHYEINDVYLKHVFDDLNNIICIEFSPCSKMIAVGADDDFIRIFDIERQTVKKIKA